MQADELKKAAGIKAAGRKSTQSVYAYALAWHPDEAGQIDKAEMLAAADASLKELKADHLQSVIVCHTDQKHPHVHVIINRVDPADGRMHPFKNDRLQLSDWANQYERERGNIVTPAREEKRKKREQYQDKKSRQDYAKEKRAQAAQNPPKRAGAKRAPARAMFHPRKIGARKLSDPSRNLHPSPPKICAEAVEQNSCKIIVPLKPWRVQLYAMGSLIMQCNVHRRGFHRWGIFE